MLLQQQLLITAWRLETGDQLSGPLSNWQQ